MLVCTSPFLPQTQKSAPPVDGIPPLGDDNADSSLRAPSVMGFTPTRNSYSAAGISSSQSLKFTGQQMGQTPLKSNRESSFVAGISSLGG